ncbi:hypothetical protein [Haloferula rosea]|uniref:Uncharacterized protein n=1 Tax=Haloferula rosea TaxID=490093 RepID=A0A934R8I4_9BACT|nr:hypothetical protein [Haloferula rosea]MBK1827204.1 hypothetical protein [Haloferula rosea]
MGSLTVADNSENRPAGGTEEADTWAPKSEELKPLFIDIPEFDEYPKDKQEACRELPNLITHGFLCYGVNPKTGKAYSGRVEFRRADDKYHLVVKRQIGDRVEWGVARFLYVRGSSEPDAKHSLRLLVVRWKSEDEVHTIRYEHIHHLNSDPESKFVGAGEALHETLVMDSL